MSIFHELKKVELHCHLDGSLPVCTIRKIAQEAGILLPEDNELLKCLQVDDEKNDLDSYLKCFDIPLMLLHTKGSIREAVLGVLEDVAKEQVIYTELRFAPLPLESESYSPKQMIEEAIDGLQEGYERFGVRGNLILCGMRHVPAEENARIIRLGREYLGAGVCAVDMAGSEAMFPITLQREFFREAKRLDMPFTIHAGECGSPSSVRDAIELGASRLGHGIAIWKDEELMKECRKSRIPLEMCPISNLQTGAAASVAEYPFPLFYRQGLNININTDNRLVSDTSLEKEFRFLQEHFGITMEDAVNLTLNAVDAAFASEDVKQELWRRVKSEI